MESTTYNCYSAEDLQAQSKTIMTALQNIQAALLKVAENDVDAGVLEEIKALLGMNTEEPSQSPTEPASTPSTTSDSATDTKTEEKDATESSKGAEPTTSHTVTVQPGDTLQTLAEKTGATPRHLIDLNMLMEPVVLRPGQTLNY